MEKIKLLNATEMEIYKISNSGNLLEISFQNGNMTELEKTFSKPEDLEKIVLEDAEGTPMAAFKNYAILKRVSKDIKVEIDQITEEVADIVTVTLEQEPAWVVSQRKQDTRIASVEEVADTLVMDALS